MAIILIGWNDLYGTNPESDASYERNSAIDIAVQHSALLKHTFLFIDNQILPGI